MPPITSSLWRMASPSFKRSTPAASASSWASWAAHHGPYWMRLRGQLGGDARAGRGPCAEHQPAEDVEGGTDAVDLLLGPAHHADELAVGRTVRAGG